MGGAASARSGERAEQQVGGAARGRSSKRAEQLVGGAASGRSGKWAEQQVGGAASVRHGADLSGWIYSGGVPGVGVCAWRSVSFVWDV